MNKEIIIQSTIICPKCGSKKKEMMPVNACQFFYQCAYCEQIIKPKQGDCCIFCSYGSVSCPPIQENGSCCN